jgi:hypothetical protein
MDATQDNTEAILGKIDAKVDTAIHTSQEAKEAIINVGQETLEAY